MDTAYALSSGSGFALDVLDIPDLYCSTSQYVQAGVQQCIVEPILASSYLLRQAVTGVQATQRRAVLGSWMLGSISIYVLVKCECHSAAYNLKTSKVPF